MSSENQLHEQTDSKSEPSVVPAKVDTSVSKNETSAPSVVNENFIENQINNFQERYRALEELLEYASEYGKLEQPNLAIEIKQLKKVVVYTPFDQWSADEICDIEAKLEKLYTTMAEMVSPVSILTLRTTSTEYQISRPWWQALFLGSGSVGRNFFRKLFWVATGLVMATMLLHLFSGNNHQVLNIYEPFLYGALGAVIFVYKNLTDRYLNRTLHPYELSTDWLRIFMGGLTGGLLVHLFSSFLPEMVVGETGQIIGDGTTGQTTSNGLNVTNMAFAFIAGYSVEFFYQLLDKIINSVTPTTDSQASQTVPSTPRQAQIEILTQRLKEMTDEEDKVTIRRLLEKI